MLNFGQTQIYGLNEWSRDCDVSWQLMSVIATRSDSKPSVQTVIEENVYANTTPVRRSWLLYLVYCQPVLYLYTQDRSMWHVPLCITYHHHHHVVSECVWSVCSQVRLTTRHVTWLSSTWRCQLVATQVAVVWWDWESCWHHNWQPLTVTHLSSLSAGTYHHHHCHHHHHHHQLSSCGCNKNCILYPRSWVDQLILPFICVIYPLLGSFTFIYARSSVTVGTLRWYRIES